MFEFEQRVRDAMVPDPLALEADASAQEAGEALTRPEVRAVLVCDHGRLVGVITRKTLVREVVAPGLDPRTTTLREIAEIVHLHESRISQLKSQAILRLRGKLASQWPASHGLVSV